MKLSDKQFDATLRLMRVSSASRTPERLTRVLRQGETPATVAASEGCHVQSVYNAVYRFRATMALAQEAAGVGGEECD